MPSHKLFHFEQLYFLFWKRGKRYSQQGDDSTYRAASVSLRHRRVPALYLFIAGAGLRAGSPHAQLLAGATPVDNHTRAYRRQFHFSSPDADDTPFCV